MLYECNYPRLLTMKYAPLVAGFLISLGMIPDMILRNPEMWPYILLNTIIPLVFAILLFILFFNIKDKLKYVAIGRVRLVVKKDGQEIEYGWRDVEEISLNRFFGMYKLKLKNEPAIYFTTYGITTWLTGDESDMGVIINKMKRELQI